jgi:hypothetical protein
VVIAEVSMDAVARWSRVLVIVGLAGMVVGVVDPLEGSLIVLPCTGMVALGAFLGNSRHQFLLYWAFGLVAVGVGAMFVLSAFGGIGGPTGHSLLWGLFILPYPVGWITGLVGAVCRLIESSRRPPS